MTKVEATAEGFVAVLKAMPKRQRDAVISRIANDEEFSKDILDLSLMSTRRSEAARPFRDYLAERDR